MLGMNLGFRTSLVAGAVALAMVSGSVCAQEKQEVHGRKWKPLPELAHVVVTVDKAFNGKPIANAGVVFHAVRDGKNDGNLEVKTDPDGRAVIDLIEVGSHVSVQVIASGFATAQQEFDADAPNKEIHFRMQRPRAQVSAYMNTDGQAAQVKPGVQEHVPGTLPKVDETKSDPDGVTK